MAALGASAFRMKSVERHARQKAREAERTWLVGGRAEERVGAELEKLLGHGFYLFYDVPLPWLIEEILDARDCYDARRVKYAVNALGAATGCYPSAALRLA